MNIHNWSAGKPLLDGEIIKEFFVDTAGLLVLGVSGCYAEPISDCEEISATLYRSVLPNVCILVFQAGF